MNERFKFRAWDIINRKMYKCAGFLSGQVIIIEDDGKVLGKNDEGFILMQFTGLKDKNGKEIYEGDLVRTIITIKKDEPGSRSRKDISVGTVIFKEGKYLPRNILNENWYSTIQTIDCWEGDYEPAIHRTSSVEVIGNTYENLELILKG
jgi:uncharacterized phage protein (TIGR01671 family)